MAHAQRPPPASWFDALPFDGAPRDALRARVLAVSPACGNRAAFATLIPPLLRRLAPAQLARYERYASVFRGGYGVFAFQPIRELMLQLAAASQLVWPGLPLDEAANALVDASADLIWSVPIMGPFVAAFDGDVLDLVETIASAGRIFYDHGHLDFERRATNEVLVVFDGQPADALRMWVPGFWRGTLRRLGLEAEVDFRLESSAVCTSRLRWRSAGV